MYISDSKSVSILIEAVLPTLHGTNSLTSHLKDEAIMVSVLLKDTSAGDRPDSKRVSILTEAVLVYISTL